MSTEALYQLMNTQRAIRRLRPDPIPAELPGGAAFPQGRLGSVLMDFSHCRRIVGGSSDMQRNNLAALWRLGRG